VRVKGGGHNMLEQGKMYRHVSTLDVDMYVKRNPLYLQDSVIVTFMYWNRNYKKFHTNNDGSYIEEKCVIPRKELWKWKEVV
jgi:hypothetical protein